MWLLLLLLLVRLFFLAYAQRVLLSLMNTHTHTHTRALPVWAHGLVPGHSDSAAGGAPAVEDYDYEGSYDYDGSSKTGASANSTRYAVPSFDTKRFSFLLFFSFLVFDFSLFVSFLLLVVYSIFILDTHTHKTIPRVQCCIYYMYDDQ